MPWSYHSPDSSAASKWSVEMVQPKMMPSSADTPIFSSTPHPLPPPSLLPRHPTAGGGCPSSQCSPQCSSNRAQGALPNCDWSCPENLPPLPCVATLASLSRISRPLEDQGRPVPVPWQLCPGKHLRTLLRATQTPSGAQVKGVSPIRRPWRLNGS